MTDRHFVAALARFNPAFAIAGPVCRCRHSTCNFRCNRELTYVQNGPEFTHALCAKAIKSMADLGVPPTPRNYEIWFAYAAGEDPELARIVDELASSGAPIAPAKLDDIHEYFFARNVKEAKLLTDIGDRLTHQLSGVLSHIEKAGEQTQAYGAALGAAEGQLAKGGATGPLAAVIENLAAATRTMQERAKALETQLARSKSEVHVLRSSIEAVRVEARTDQLTGLANRKAFDEAIRGATARATDSKEPLALLMCDIDHFKRFNDTYGHQTGDQVLRVTAHCLRESVKGRDIPARFGGEEFAVLLPHTTLSHAAHLAEQVRVLIASKKLVKKSTGENLGTVTISIGAALYRPGEPAGDFIERADACLYAAKRAGRNRVLTEGEVDVAHVLEAASAARTAKIAAA